MLDHALYYASQGLAVFPLNGKIPATPNGCHDATTDPATIQNWWSARPDANIGIATGAKSGLLVIDVDGAEGAAALLSLSLPPTLEVESPGKIENGVYQGKGRHLYYRHVPGVTIGQSKLAPKIDHRGEGGYVVAPPSIHPHGTGQYTWRVNAPVAELPAQHVARLLPAPAATLDSVRESKTLENHVRALSTAAPGTKHQALVEASYAFACAAQEAKEPRETAEPRVTAILKLALELNPSKVQDWGNVYATIRSGFSKAYGRSAAAAPALPSSWGLESAAAMASPLTPPTWLSKDLQLGPGRPVIVAGYGASGKTLAAQSLALSVASGQPIWGQFPVTHRGAVIHLDYEQGRYATFRRYQRLAHGMGINLAALDTSLKVRAFPEKRLTDEDIVEALSMLCDGASLLIVDSLRAATPGVDENASEVQRYVQNLARVGEATGCTCLLIHHARKKSEGDSDIRTILRGSSAIFDAAGSIYAITTSGDTRRVDHAKAPAEAEDGPLPGFELAIEQAPGTVDCDKPLRVLYQRPPSKEEQSKARAGAAHASVFQMILSKGLAGATKTLIREASGARRDAAYVALEDLLDQGAVVKRGDRFVAAEVLAAAEGVFRD